MRAATAAPAAPGTRARLATVALLLALTVAAFGGAVRNQFVLLDDPEYVTENAHVLSPFTGESMRWSLTSPHGGNWHPLTTWSHMLDVKLFGLDAGAHHAENVLLHGLNAVLLLLVLWRLTGSWWRSAAVAGLFALHPLRVESVAWAAERKDVLSGSFFLLTLLAYGAWARAGGRGRYAWVCVALGLGLLSKPMLVSVPLVLLVVDGWPLRRTWSGERVREKWPLFAMVAALAAVTLVVQQRSGAFAIVGQRPLAERLLNALLACGNYVGKSFWPANLAPYYPYSGHPDVLRALLSLAGLVLMTALAFAQRARRPWLLTGWLWFLVMLLPVIGIVQVGPQAWADRYSYLPTIGLAIMLVWTVADGAERVPARRLAAGVVLAAALAGLGIATARQVARWRDSETLFRWMVHVVPSASVIHLSLGDLYMREGRPALAAPAYRKVLEYRPGDVSVMNDLAIALASLGRPGEAREWVERGLQAAPSAEGWFNLGMLELRGGRAAEAIGAFEHSLAIDSTHAPTHAQLALALLRAGQPEAARARLERALAIDPGDVGARRLLGELRSPQGAAAPRGR